MLSPGKFYERVPTDPAANLRYRKHLLAWAEESAVNRLALIEACRCDILFYAGTFVFQTNPLKVGHEVGPFIPWPFQRKLMLRILGNVEAGRSLVVEKSRDMGVTWCDRIVDDWLGRFHPNKECIAISHTELAVDNVTAGASKSMFGKMRFIQRHLPGWMPKMLHKKLQCRYPDTGSVIAGASTTKRAGVGDRATKLTLDEFALQDDAAKIWSNTADTGPRVVISTHYGVGTEFYKLATAGSVDKVVVHWTEHPEKGAGKYRYDPATNRVLILDKSYEYPPDFKFVREALPAGGPHPGVRSPWYDAQVRERADLRAVAMHLDIDPQGAGHQFYDGATIAELIRQPSGTARDPVWQGDVRVSDDGRVVSLDRSTDGPLKLWVNLDYQDRPPKGTYGAGADVAAGKGKTPSCLSIGDALGQQVAEYASAWIEPDAFARLAVALCRLFADHDGGGALFAWEADGPGGAVTDEVIRIGYRNIYYRTDDDHLVAVPTDRPGWVRRKQSERVLFEAHRSAVQSGKCVIRSEATLYELLDYEFLEGGKIGHARKFLRGDPAAAGENHGDRGVADALRWLATKTDVLRPFRQSAQAARQIHPGTLAGRMKLAEDEERQNSEEWVTL